MARENRSQTKKTSDRSDGRLELDFLECVDGRRHEVRKKKEEETIVIHKSSRNCSLSSDWNGGWSYLSLGGPLLASASVTVEQARLYLQSFTGVAAQYPIAALILRCMIFDMLPFFVYFAAGLITGFHVYTLLALAVYGAPFNPLEVVALLGSLCLMITAYVSLFKPHAAARLALVASLAIWCFYGPAIAKSIRTKLNKQSSVSRDSGPVYPHAFWVPLAVTNSAVDYEGRCISPRILGAN